MFLRWMIRKDKSGVDFGLWKLKPALLTCPLDVHSARVARKLGLLKRKQNDWQAAAELTKRLRDFDPNDGSKHLFDIVARGVRYPPRLRPRGFMSVRKSFHQPPQPRSVIDNPQ